jgi:hypothetical protein
LQFADGDEPHGKVSKKPKKSKAKKAAKKVDEGQMRMQQVFGAQKL